MPPRTLLVTGGAGFIGSCFVRQAIAADDTRVVNFDKLTYAGNTATLGDLLTNPRHHFIQGDICDRSQIAQLLNRYQPEWIVNFAAESHVDRSIDTPESFVQPNVVGTVNLLTAALDHWEKLSPEAQRRFRFLQISTDEVYGSLHGGQPLAESARYAPNSPYSASKAAADHFVRAFHQTYGLPVLTVCASNNYGPFQFPEKLIPVAILAAVEGRPLPVYGDGTQRRDWLFVEDHCRAIGRVLEAGQSGEVYHIASGERRSNLELVQLLCTLVDQFRPNLPHAPSTNLIRHVTDRPGHDRRYALSTEKIETQLNWRPSVTLEAGLTHTVQWYLENAAWVEHVASCASREKRLGQRGTS